RPTQATRRDMFGIDASPFTPTWDKTTAHLSAEPTLGIDGKLYASDFSHNVSTVVTANGTFTTLFSVGTNANGFVGRVPLHGSDGHWYLPTTDNVLTAREGAKLSWMFAPSGSILGAVAIDCQG